MPEPEERGGDAIRSRHAILWITLGVLYACFLGWYDWSGGPLTAKEIDGYVAKLETQGLAGTRVVEEARAFAEHDDGDEFFMVNLENERDEPLIPADLDPDTDPREVEQLYQASTGLKMIARAGHPIMAIRGSRTSSSTRALLSGRIYCSSGTGAAATSSKYSRILQRPRRSGTSSSSSASTMRGRRRRVSISLACAPRF